MKIILAFLMISVFACAMMVNSVPRNDERCPGNTAVCLVRPNNSCGDLQCSDGQICCIKNCNYACDNVN
ncbi:unnamed protein product [Allacma fusca]|uniref:WAP domain-containing protein n=1 Tax=Allacma fusca TaxID=39272 RepID=A0A8J2PMR4_9HEXA|nr:unnamed protein product [Allacma fusca]